MFINEEKKKKQIQLERLKKEEKEFLIYIKIEFILEKKYKKGVAQFKKLLHVFQKTQETLRTLMVRKKYVWYINLKKTNKRKKKKKNSVWI